MSDEVKLFKKNEQAPDFGRPVRVQVAVGCFTHINFTFAIEGPQSANSCI